MLSTELFSLMALTVVGTTICSMDITVAIFVGTLISSAKGTLERLLSTLTGFSLFIAFTSTALIGVGISVVAFMALTTGTVGSSLVTFGASTALTTDEGSTSIFLTTLSTSTLTGLLTLDSVILTLTGWLTLDSLTLTSIGLATSTLGVIGSLLFGASMGLGTGAISLFGVSVLVW